MSKEKETPEENLFEGFNLLNNAPSKSVAKKPIKEEVIDTDTDELSEEDLAALALAEKGTKASSKKKEEVIEEKEEDQPEEGNEFLGFAKFLSEEGIVDFEESEEIKTEKDLAKIVGKTIKKGIDEYKSSKPEDVQKFLDFVDNGGNPSDFHKYYYGDASFENFDINSEENQKYIITEALKQEEYTPEEIEAELADLEDLGKLDKKAAIYLKKFQKIEKEQKNLLVEAQKDYAIKQQEAIDKEWTTFKDGLYKKEEIGGFKFTPKMKDDLWDYMVKPINKKTGETQYQKDQKESEDARYIFAYLLKNKWDVKSLEKQVESKQVSKLKGSLSNYSDSRAKLKSAASKIELEDNSSNPFAAFKKALN